MQTIVFFSNDGIQVLQGVMKSGRLVISHFQTLPVEAGALINGVITNEDVVKQAISEAMAEDPDQFKNMKLVIESSLIATKNVEVPKLKPKELAALAVTEFEDTAGNYEDLIVDYSRIPGPNGHNLFCCGVEKRVIESYVSLFESLKIKVHSIDVGLNAIIQYVSGTKDYNGMTFALNILDGKNLLSILFENGHYIFSTRSRLMAEHGTDAFADELSAKLSSLIQFNKSQKSEHALTMSLYAGLDEFELNTLKKLIFDAELSLFSIPQTPNVKDAFAIDETFDFGKFLFPIVGFFTGSKPINLLQAYKKSMVVKKERFIAYKLLAIPGGMLVIILVVFITFVILQFNMQKNLDWMNAYISNQNNQESYLKAKALSDEVTGINTAVSNMELINTAINSNPKLVSEKLNHIATLCNGVITLNTINYNGDTGVLKITATADNEQEAAYYVERLKATDYFTQVGYTGYTMVEKTTTETTPATTTTTTTTTNTIPGTTTTTTIRGYSFNVDAYLKAGNQQ